MLAELDATLLVLFAFVFGLMIGSFLNVVIYRLPKMMERQWEREALAITNPDAAAAPREEEAFNLLVPRSRCGQCGQAIVWYENIPIISYLFLRAARESVFAIPWSS